MFVVMLRNMDMVLTLLEFIRATRDGIWPLHLSSMEGLCKHFFANNRLKCTNGTTVPCRDAFTKRERSGHLDRVQPGAFLCQEKSSAFLQHRCRPCTGTRKPSNEGERWTVSITQKLAALLRFFLIAPELTRLSEEVMQMAGISSSQRTKHHELSQAITECRERNIQKVKSVMVECHPFQQEDPCLKNFVTKAVMPEPVKRDILQSITVGQE